MATSKPKNSGTSTKEAVVSTVKIVLNGGGLTMDSATIPVEWHFSPEVIEARPQFIALYDLEMSLDELKKNLSARRGERSLYRVSDLATYLQFKKPGRHTLVALVFCGDQKKALQQGKKFCSLDSDSYGNIYNYALYADKLADGVLIDTYFNEQAVYTVAVEFEVPEQLFAPVPQSGWHKFIWAWTNRWYSHGPRDECQYRKRKILAFTLQPVLFLIGRAITGISVTLYTLVGSILLVLIGVRPDTRNFVHAWWNIDAIDKNLVKFNDLLFEDYFRLYKRVKVQGPSGKSWDYEIEHRHIPAWLVPIFIPFELAAIGGAGFGIYELARLVYYHPVMILVVVAAILVITAITIGGVKTFGSVSFKQIIEAKAEEGKKRQIELKEQAEKHYLEFLKNNASLANVPTHVDIGVIKKKVDNVTKFHMSFWAMKAKVCRPFTK